MGMDNKLIDDEIKRMESCSMIDLYDLRAQWRLLHYGANRIILERDSSFSGKESNFIKIISQLKGIFIPDDNGFVRKKRIRFVIHELNIKHYNNKLVEKEVYKTFINDFKVKEYNYCDKTGKRYRCVKGLKLSGIKDD